MTRVWTLGTVFVVRHAGMPFDWLESLGGPADLHEAAERLLDAEEELRAAAGSAFPRLAAAVEECAPERLPGVPAPAREAADAWRAAAARYREAHRTADEAATKELRRLLERPEVAEAVLLSNPDALRNMLRPLLAHDGPLTSRYRRARRQLYTYVQRFCAKNETVSFFGPMAYGEVDPGLPTADGALLSTRLPRTRRVFVSHWAGRALLRAVTRDTALLPDLPFHRTCDGEPAWPDGASPEDAAAARTVLAALTPDGTTLRGLVRTLGTPARELARALRLLVAADAADVGLGGGPFDLEPLTTLRDGLDRLPPSAARDRWIARIEGLEALRAALQTAGPDEREAAIGTLERAFSEATGEPARRAAGSTYADRAVFYEEGSSPFALRIGPALAARWEQRLRGVLELCTAHGHLTQRAAADAVRSALGTGARLDLGRYAAAAAEAFPAPGSAFAVAHAPDYPAADRERHTTRLRELADGLRGDRYALVDLCPRASGAAGLADADLVVARVHHHLLVPGWLDTMHPEPRRFAAAAADWVARQDGRVVGFDFGRRNKGYYRFPGRAVALRPASWTDAGDPPLRPRDLTVELGEPPGPASGSGHGYETGPGYEPGYGMGSASGSGTGVRLLDPDGREVTAYIPLNDFVKYAPFAALSHPQVLHPAFTASEAAPEAALEAAPQVASDAARDAAPDDPPDDPPGGAPGTAHGGTALGGTALGGTALGGTAPVDAPHGGTDPGALPEVAVDGVVLQRPRWRVDASRLRRSAPHARFLELRRLARRTGLRFLFCRAPGERKPYLLDLASPLAADLAAHIGHREDVLTAEAMSPAPGDLWLRDEQGRRYTCELRMQFTGREVAAP
ncbi:lantibiotic dehydratase [Streptomyces tirandamycinicus]|uniref:lantibiotic dehydratase n=1 Tax=Streptomyces tirandamycinicus TaxID=2174846 RepID=UPI003445786C